MESEKKRRALLLTHIIPDRSGIGLTRRAWRWAAELASSHQLEIVVVTTHPPASAPQSVPGIMRFVRRPGPPLRSRRLADWIDPDAETARILSTLPGPPPDRLVVFRFYMHDIATLLPPEWLAVAEMDCDDWEAATRWSLAMIALRRGRYALGLSRLFQAARYALLERKFLRSYRLVHISAFEDAALLCRLAGLRNIQATPNKIAREPGFAPSASAASSRMLLFVGTLFYPPNEDAMLWFGQAILPLLRGLVPDVRVIAAGTAEERLQRCLAGDGIDYVHAPEDLVPLYAQAAAVIAPLRGGGGTKLKVLEAWLQERPLVVTSHAARGLVAEKGRHFLIADKPDGFARACAAVLTDGELAARLVRESCDLLRTRYLMEDFPTDGDASDLATTGK